MKKEIPDTNLTGPFAITSFHYRSQEGRNMLHISMVGPAKRLRGCSSDFFKFSKRELMEASRRVIVARASYF